MFDIETTSVFSSSGMIIAIGIFDPKEMKEPFINLIKDPEDEAKLLNWFKDKVKGYDAICGWNSKSFDLPFILGRALQLGLDFSELKEVEHIDLIEISRANFRFRSNRLEDVCKLLCIKYEPVIDGEKLSVSFIKGISGREEDLEKIKQRCKNDLLALFEVYKKFEPYLNFSSKTKT
jgi:uncharacterized protein YprB with RNaseH-like and TPR domain